MSIAIALWLALLAPQATTPATPPTQPAPQPPASSTNAPTQTGPAANGTPLRRIGGGVMPPRLIYSVPPKFTTEARKSKMTGVTLVNLIVDAKGMPQNVHVLRSMADTVGQEHREAALTLDSKAVEAVKQYRFAPATEGGKPVPVELNVEVNFQVF